jgi:squalene cyclase
MTRQHFEQIAIHLARNSATATKVIETCIELARTNELFDAVRFTRAVEWLKQGKRPKGFTAVSWAIYETANRI